MHPLPPTASGSEDSRVYLDRLSGNWRYEDDQGDEWEWTPFVQHVGPAVDQGEVDEETSAPSSSSSAQAPSGHWVKVLDEDLIKAQQAAYSVAGVDESTPSQAVLRRGKKRAASSPSAQPSMSSFTSSNIKSKIPPSKRPKPITSLYVTGLPLDSTASEIASVFSRYGVLLEDDHGLPRVKTYYDDNTGMFRGEALVVYFKAESVELAIQMLDGTSLRGAIGQSSCSGPIMSVRRAEFPTHTSSGSNVTINTNSAEKGSNSYTPSTPGAKEKANSETIGQRRNLSDQERKKIARRVAKLENKLSDWRDDSDSDTIPTAVPPFTTPSQPSKSNHTALTNSNGGRGGGRTVVLTKMFTLSELEEDPTLLLDLKEDVRDECSEMIGGVTNVVLWDQEPEGLITVKFKTSEQARQCVNMMQGRFFARRRIDAFVMSAKPKLRRSGKGPDDAVDSDNEGQGHADKDEEKRRDAFATWLHEAS
ncbi:related to Splicing factor U2AF-associated protein 2 [Melanopsichium pennsylvanicum]|uniref:Related to Splicing factor U2AF-associated protein 2 n=2 Tax=Melanopsichium pennsylvanicum TaxID=63383 RepID=A0AAJ4XGX3_9BASI|nr:related to Splicing factor U2AF-associated protein 2 [Melanopsichium pennsylvanicum 4]SNX81933.1 related to Splicing factor U2AF-associated protein 2 [Melanopsichium pennsylvanicum]